MPVVKFRLGVLQLNNRNRASQLVFIGFNPGHFYWFFYVPWQILYLGWNFDTFYNSVENFSCRCNIVIWITTFFEDFFWLGCMKKKFFFVKSSVGWSSRQSIKNASRMNFQVELKISRVLSALPRLKQKRRLRRRSCCFLCFFFSASILCINSPGLPQQFALASRLGSLQVLLSRLQIYLLICRLLLFQLLWMFEKQF